jgi:hypothetical protein
MDVKLRELVESQNTLNKIFNDGRINDIKLMFVIGMVKKEVLKWIDSGSSYGQVRERLIKEYTRNEEEVINGESRQTTKFKGKTKEEQDESQKQFDVKFNELLDEVIQVKIKPIELETLAKLDMKPPLSGSEIYSILWWLKVPEEE